MILSIQQIDSLNKSMLGLGAPDVRDNVGYNKSDFYKMETIGRLCVELDFIEAYAVLQSLNTYKNTQLSSIKEDIEETISAYDAEFIKRYGADEDKDNTILEAQEGASHTKNDYIKRTLIYHGNDEGQLFSEGYFFVAFREFINDIDLDSFGGHWHKLSNGKFAVAIPYDSMDSFLSYAAHIGKYGYVASNELLAALKEYESNRADTNNDTLRFTSLNKKNKYGYDLYEINTKDYTFAQKLWDLKGKGVAYVDTKSSVDSIIISTNDKMLSSLLEFLKESGVDVSLVVDRLNDDAETQKDLNKSNNELIDISNLDMPFAPYPFQIIDAKTIVSKKKALMGHDMGCGKTFISVLVGMSIPVKKLVVCPETLRLNWEREITQTDRNADVKIVYSKDKEPLFGKDWTIMGYKTAVKFERLIINDSFDCIFVDEAHKCKAVNNYGKPSSKQAETIMRLSQKMEYTYLLTGTPMPTRNKDLYNELVMLGEIDNSEKYAFHKFGTTYCDGHRTDFGWDYNGSSNSDELHNILSKYMTRRLKSVVLPNLTKQRIPILIETPLSRDYLDIERNLYCADENETFMGNAMKGRRFLSKCKISSAIELAETICEADESVVIVAEFNDTLDALMEHFGDNACCIRGGMSDTEKQKAIDDFQSGIKSVCCINLIAAGVGITLTKAHNMIICDYDWTPSNMTQVEDRICRAGQDNHCNIYYLSHKKAILDEIFIEMITDKSANIDKVIDNANNTVDLVELHNDKANNNRKDDYISRLKKRIEANGGKLPKPKKPKTRATNLK